jgi:hypothetical protein
VRWGNERGDKVGLAGKVTIHKNCDVRQHETTRSTCGANDSFVEMLIRACSGCSLFCREDSGLAVSRGD